VSLPEIFALVALILVVVEVVMARHASLLQIAVALLAGAFLIGLLR
jgi:hypothetical protein